MTSKLRPVISSGQLPFITCWPTAVKLMVRCHNVCTGVYPVIEQTANRRIFFSMCLNILSGNEKKKCHCGAKNCSSFLGVRPKNQVQEEKSKKPVDKRKKKRIKKTVVKEGKWMFLLHVGAVLLKVISELMQWDSRKTRGAIHSTKIQTGPTRKRGPPQKVDQFFQNFSGWTELIH